MGRVVSPEYLYLTNAIRPQISSSLEGFNELVPRGLISILNDKELVLLISGLPEIDLDDLKTNADYTGYTAASSVVQWFWEVVKGFSQEDMARLLQFVTGTSKVPLEGFNALQAISGPQKFQIHKAYGAPERLPSALISLIFPSIPQRNNFRNACCLLSMKPAKVLALVDQDTTRHHLVAVKAFLCRLHVLVKCLLHSCLDSFSLI